MGEECGLVKFGPDCVLMVEYQGYQRKFSQLPGYKRLITDVVREQDEFEYDNIEGTIRHKPNTKARSAKIIFAYCIVQFHDADPWFEVLDEADIERHKRRAQGGGVKGPWATDYKEMARKSAIHALAARYQSAIPGMAQQVRATNEAEQTEYQRTGGDPEHYEQSVSDLHGDDPQLTYERMAGVVPDDRPAMRAPKVWDTEAGELVDTATGEVEETDAGDSLDDAQKALQARAAFHDDLRAYLRQAGFKRGEVASIVAQCAEELGEMPVPTFDDITSMDLLQAIRLKAQSIRGHMEPDPEREQEGLL
jgi:hypothetical protein